MEGVNNTVWIWILRLLYIMIKVYVKFAHLPEGRKSLPCVKGGGSRKRDGGIVKSNNFVVTIPQSASLTAPFTQGSLFYVRLCLVNFPDKHCICWHKRKYGIPLSRYAIFLKNCPLEWRSKEGGFFCIIHYSLFIIHLL